MRARRLLCDPPNLQFSGPDPSWPWSDWQTRCVIKVRWPLGPEAQSHEAQGLLVLALPEEPQYRAVGIGNIHGRLIGATFLYRSVRNTQPITLGGQLS